MSSSTNNNQQTDWYAWLLKVLICMIVIPIIAIIVSAIVFGMLEHTTINVNNVNPNQVITHHTNTVDTIYVPVTEHLNQTIIPVTDFEVVNVVEEVVVDIDDLTERERILHYMTENGLSKFNVCITICSNYELQR